MYVKAVTLEDIAISTFECIAEPIDTNYKQPSEAENYKQFIIKNNKPFYDDYYGSSIEVKVIPGDTSVMEAGNILKNDPIALVTNQKNIFCGYVTQAMLTSQLQFEYQKLLAYLNTILDTIEDSCTVIDEQARVVCWTKGAEKIFSIKKEDIINQPITNHFTSKHLEILNALNKGDSVHRHQHHARNDLVVLINSNPVIYEKEIIGAVVSETDITNMVRLNNELYKASEMLFQLEEEVRKSSETKNPFSFIRGSSVQLQNTLKIAKKAAKTDAPVLIYGESGVGKELFAKGIHHLREKEDSPFIAINCGAISSSLFESEIFGYESGAFSGADVKGKKGKAEMASGGTLFLDEVGEMPLDMQVKFLRLLQEKRFYRVGGTKEIEVDFRIIAATNRDLDEMIAKGDFREDLYYRLNVVHFNVPPLRDRPQDIIELTHYFLYEMSITYNRPIHGISQEVMQSLLNHDWKGNIRELKNIIERMVVFSDNGEIKLEDLPSELNKDDGRNLTLLPSESQSYQLSLADQLEEFEREIILRELKRHKGNKKQCANTLGITRATLYNRMKRLGIESEAGKD